MEHLCIVKTFFQTLDDHSHMVFVQNNIHEILELLVEPGNTQRPDGPGYS